MRQHNSGSSPHRKIRLQSSKREWVDKWISETTDIRYILNLTSSVVSGIWGVIIMVLGLKLLGCIHAIIGIFGMCYISTYLTWFDLRNPGYKGSKFPTRGAHYWVVRGLTLAMGLIVFEIIAIVLTVAH